MPPPAGISSEYGRPCALRWAEGEMRILNVGTASLSVLLAATKVRR